MLKKEKGRKAKAKITTSEEEQMCEFLLMKDPIVGSLPSVELCEEDKKFLLEKDVDEKEVWDKKPPDILLGVKDAIQILKGCETIEMPSGLQLLNTKIGWIVAGEMNVIQGAMSPHVANDEMNALLGKVKKKSDVANEPSEFSN